MRIIKKGATSQSIYFSILDSTSTTGGKKTGLVFNTSGLTAYYALNAGSATAITLATLAAANSAFSSGGFKEVDATNMPGLYRLDVPNAAMTGADSVVISLKGATGMVQVDIEIQLSGIDIMDAVRFGITALPNAAAEAAGGLYTRGSGAGQINQPANGQIDANTVKVSGTAQTARDLGASVLLTAAESGILQSGTAAAGAGSTITIASAIGADNRPNGCIIKITSGTGVGQARGIIGYVDSTKVVTVDRAWTTNPDNTSVYAIMFAEVPKLDTNLKVAGVVLADTVTTYTGNTVQTGDNFARLGTPVGASISADIAAAKANLVTLIAAIGSWTGTGINNIKGFLLAIMKKDAALTPSDVGGTYDNTLHSLEAQKNAAASTDDMGIMINTTIATLASQTSFTLTAGSANNSAYNGCKVMIRNASTSTQKCLGVISAYTGASKTVTLQEDPAIFTMAVGDFVSILPAAVDVFKRQVDGTTTFEQGQRLQNSAAAGKLSGAATTTVAIRDLADTKDRVSATVDANGNRSAVTLNVT